MCVCLVAAAQRPFSTSEVKGLERLIIPGSSDEKLTLEVILHFRFGGGGVIQDGCHPLMPKMKGY